MVRKWRHNDPTQDDAEDKVTEKLENIAGDDLTEDLSDEKQNEETWCLKKLLFKLRMTLMRT